MPSTPSLRVLGVSVPDVGDWREAIPLGKWSQFFGALARRYELVDVIRPELQRHDHYLNLTRAFRPRMRSWRGRSSFNQYLASKRTKAVQRRLWRYQGDYDLIMQLQTLCAPGFDRQGVPYAIYTDNTMALTKRLYPAGMGLSPDAAAEWMCFEAEICQSASAVFTFSEFARCSVIDDYGCSPERVVAVGAGANQSLGSLGEKDYSAPRALFVGVDFARKGGYILLEAWRTVQEHVPDAELIIAGPNRDPGRTGFTGVSWVGQVDRDALAMLYKSASVFVMPSLFDAWGHVLLEAMGHGLPCIGTSCCAMPEIIDDGITGRLVPPRQIEALAAGLIELLSEPKKTATMGTAAHAKVLNGSRWSDVIDRIATHLQV